MASKYFSVLGSPIEHSRSPLIHSTAYGVLGLDWDYQKNEVRKGGLRRFLAESNIEFSGLSVTMPLKEEAARLAESLDEAARLTGAVNTLSKTETGWAGFNTDVFGITQAVASKVSTGISKVLILGSGATATSAMLAVSRLAPEARVWVMARNPETRAQLVQFGLTLGLQVKPTIRLKSVARSADLVISTLPGSAMDSVVRKLRRFGEFRPTGAVLDVAYSPWPSQFAAFWSQVQRPIISGLDMLMWQAVAQLRVFTNSNPDLPLHNEIAVVEAIKHALDQAV